nr:meprin-A [mice, kidney, Peptide Partial, 8 aa] [Mus sp.]
NAMRDPSS